VVHIFSTAIGSSFIATEGATDAARSSLGESFKLKFQASREIVQSSATQPQPTATPHAPPKNYYRTDVDVAVEPTTLLASRKSSDTKLLLQCRCPFASTLTTARKCPSLAARLETRWCLRRCPCLCFQRATTMPIVHSADCSSSHSSEPPRLADVERNARCSRLLSRESDDRLDDRLLS